MKNLILAAAAIVIIGAGPAAAQNEFNKQRKALSSGELAQRLDAVSYFSGLGTEAAYAVMIDLFAGQTNPYTKIRIVESMDVARSSAAYAAVFSALNDPSPQVRQAAVISLARHPSPVLFADKFGVMLASDTSRAVRMSILNSLSLSPSSSSAAAIEAALADRGADPDLRLMAVKSLGRMGIPEAAAIARKYTADPDPEVKRTAAAIAAKK
jgi:HEAT repeat protein